MKYPYLQHVRLLIVIFLSILFISCKKDNTGSRPGAPSFTWTIDGVNYVADEATAFTNDIEARKTVGADVKHVEIAFWYSFTEIYNFITSILYEGLLYVL